MRRDRWVWVVAVALLALPGCASRPVGGAPVALAPVSKPCALQPPARPDFAVDALPLDAELWAMMRALRAERQQRIGYELELEAVARGCAGG